MKTVVYIDGYNLYYGLLRRTQYKWLDIFALFQNHVLDSTSEVTEVRYYTAPVLGRMSDDSESPKRQRTYLQALRKFRGDTVKIIEGKMVSKKPYLRLVDPIPEAPEIKRVRVIDFSEKKTDVNIAVDMLDYACKGEVQQIILCSNDSDLEAAISSIKRNHPQIRVGLVAPIQKNRKISTDLSKHADWSKILSPTHLEASQLPDKIPHTSIRKPEKWQSRDDTQDT